MKIIIHKLPTNIDNISLSLTIYEVENPKAIIQVIHGMSEHQNRYKNLATKLCTAGYNVVTSDIRGHGLSINNNEDLGYFGVKNCCQNLINDQLLITKFIIEQYPKKLVYLFTHSMGTIIARNYLQTNDVLINKVILCGAPNYQRLVHLGKTLSSVMSLFSKDNPPSKLLAKMTTGTFNKCVKNPTSGNDWISYNKANVENYTLDDLCGFHFTIKGYNTLYKLLIRMHKKHLYKLNNNTLDILFIAGSDDPCIGKEKGIKASIRTLSKAGYHNIDYILYPNMRHEILNEENNNKVFDDIISFYNKKNV